VTGKQHAYAIAAIAADALAAAPARGSGRRQRELAGVASLIADGRREEAALAARAAGVLELIEDGRNAHLARLDADDGLQALGIDWEDVALLIALRSGPRRGVRARRRR
jgi:hypothetical protein